MADLPRDFRSQAYLMTDEVIDWQQQEFSRLCQSPIEVAFAVAFVLAGNHAFGRVAVADKSVTDLTTYDEGASLVLAPQRSIFNYRCDFIAFQTPYRPSVQIVVECDGHEFHERTKEQAQHDRERDRVVQRAGYKVFRFTGSEIYRDAFLCAREVLGHLLDLDWQERS